jgi:short-subunit dehydrogenase
MARAPRSLVGQVVAITGGARGIGRATGAALITQGARVAIGDIDAPRAARTAQELGGGTVGLPLDVTDPASFEVFLQDVETQLGPLDVLVNNAGVMPIGAFVDEPDATAALMVDINLNGVIFGSKLALKRFLPRGRGHLVNIASTAGKVGFPGGATYCATKHAVVGLRGDPGGGPPHGHRGQPGDAGGVNTELGSGLAEARGFKAVEPEDVANAIVQALQTGRFDVFVPRSFAVLVRLQSLVPRRAIDAVARMLKGDQVLAHPDHTARAAYETRIAETIAAAAAAATEPGGAAPAIEREREAV